VAAWAYVNNATSISGGARQKAAHSKRLSRQLAQHGGSGEASRGNLAKMKKIGISETSISKRQHLRRRRGAAQRRSGETPSRGGAKQN